MRGEGELRQAMTDLEGLGAGRVSPCAYHRIVAPGCAADGCLSFAYHAYGPAMDQLWAAFTAAGFEATPADYTDWLRRTGNAHDPARIAQMDRDDLMMLLLAIRRGERFAEGHWAAMLDRGVFLAIGRRLLELN